MRIRRNREGQEEGERQILADQIAGLRADIKALGRERDSTKELTDLQREVEKLKLEKARLTEDNDRKIRETTHKVGLLKVQQEHDIDNARRETKVEVREENLAAERKRFEGEMKFQREHMQREVDRFDGIAKALMERLPVIEVSLDGSVPSSPRPRAASGRKSED